jgi:acetyltransferase-like isoleucine patch superfamily enzyme
MSDFTKIKMPFLGVNDTKGLIIVIDVVNGDFVNKGDMIFEVETTKAALSVEAESDGYVWLAVSLDETAKPGDVLGLLSATDTDLSEELKKLKEHLESEPNELATKKAVKLADELGVDINKVIQSLGKLVREKDVNKYFDTLQSKTKNVQKNRKPIMRGMNGRVVVVRAGRGATQVLSILSHEEGTEVIGLIDDDECLNKKIFGDNRDAAPLLGKISELEKICKENSINGVACGAGPNEFRQDIYHKVKSLGLKMVNVIHPTVVYDDNITIGEGNYIGANSYIGNSTSIGNYCFLSSGCIIEHHNTWGDGVYSGPNVTTSGSVTIGDNVKFASGIIVEPNINIGNETLISSGSIITNNVSSNLVIIKDYNQVEKEKNWRKT